MAVETNFNTAVVDVIEGLSASAKTEFSRVVWQNGIVGSELADRHTLVTDVLTGDPVVILDNRRKYNSFPYSDPTSCSLNECDLDVDFSLKTWLLGNYNCRVPICMKSFDKDFLYFFNTHYQVLHDLTLEEQLLLFLQDRFVDSLVGATWRTAYFADNSLISTDPFYGLLRGSNGFFTQAEAGDGIKYEFNQTNPTGEDAYDALEIAYNDYMTSEWSDQQVVWKMTRKMAALLVRWLNNMTDRSMYNCECFSADGLTAQRTFTLNGNLTFFGIPVEIENDLDGVISGLPLDRPFRTLLIAKTNLQIGTQKADDIKRFDMWYDKKDRNVYIDGEFLLGSMIPVDEYVYIGAEDATPVAP